MRIRMISRHGFTLIESLAAFAILAISLGQLLNGVSGSVRNEARADFLLRAVRQGASQLDALGVNGPVPFGESWGRYPDGLRWALSVTPGRAGPNVPGVSTLKGFLARVVIKKPSGYGESYTLSTLKLKTEPPRPVQ